VLVIDDEQMNIEVIKAMLGEQGLTADIALSGNTALSLLE